MLERFLPVSMGTSRVKVSIILILGDVSRPSIREALRSDDQPYILHVRLFHEICSWDDCFL